MRHLRKTDYITIAIYTGLITLLISGSTLLLAIQSTKHHAYTVQVNGGLG